MLARIVSIAGCVRAAAGRDFASMTPKIGANLNYVPIAERNGVEIIPETRVEKVILEKRGTDYFAAGVWAEQDGKKVQFLADAVIVSAGNNGTPRILYDSGYGPKELLGSQLIVENPNVGQHVDGRFYGPRFSALFPFPLKEGDRGMARAICSPRVTTSNGMIGSFLGKARAERNTLSLPRSVSLPRILDGNTSSL